ncbi:hypothetical protein ACP4OV_022292 [Aristida adscensionis]
MATSKFYLVDSGYPNRPGYLAPYRCTRYHLPEFRSGAIPRGKKELFNYTHSSLRSVIERSFGVLKMKWRMLGKVPSYPERKQSKIILACMALHNFIRENAQGDEDFALGEAGVLEDVVESQLTATPIDGTPEGEEDQDMNELRDQITNGLYNRG